MAANKRHRVIRKRKRLSIEAYANRLRKRMTRAETVLWKHLQKKMVQWEVEFIPQGVVLGLFVADFVCHSHNLIIEVDGSIHKLPHIKIKDQKRTKILNLHGYRVIRFTNYCVLTNHYYCIRTIYDHMRE